MISCVVKKKAASSRQLSCWLALVCILLHMLAVPSKTTPSKTTASIQPYITINFPSTEIGKYYLVKPGTLYTEDARLSDYKPARGAVNIAANSQIALKLTYYGSTNTSLLKAIPAQAVRYLNLGQIEIGNAEFQDLLHFNELVSLDMGGTDVNDNGTVGLRNLTKLQHLDIGFCPIGLSTVEEISHLKELLRLTFSSNTLGDKATYAGKIEELSAEQLKQLQRRLPKVILEEGTKLKDFDPDLC